jgi:signal transduction histidine kinase
LSALDLSARAAALVVDAAGRVSGCAGELFAPSDSPASNPEGQPWREALASLADPAPGAVLPESLPSSPQSYDLRARDGATLLVHAAPMGQAGQTLLLLWRTPAFATDDLRHERMRTLGTLAASAAHEMNNVLTLIFGWLQLFVADEQDEERRKNFQLVTDAAERLSFLTRNLLEFARAPLARVGPVNVNQAVEDILALVGYQVEKSGIKLRSELESGLPRIQGNRAELGHACLNLILNAMHAMPSGGTLTVRTCADEGHVVLEIADTGCGMPPEVRQRIFQPFFTTRAGDGGSGLGLAVCREIVARHGGETAVRSEVGKGTVFTLRFPVRTEETADVVNT